VTIEFEFRQRISFLRRLGRAGAGLLLGWIWSSVVSLIGVIAVAVAYGDLDRGLDRLKGEWWAIFVIPGYLVSTVGAWAGSVAGPFALGPTRLQKPVLTSSALGSAAGTVYTAVVGTIAAWVTWQNNPRSEWIALFPLALSLPLGILAGGLVGRMLSHFLPPQVEARLPRRSDTSK
jgi:hypothetical protein